MLTPEIMAMVLHERTILGLKHTCIVVVDINKNSVGLVVDEVREVVDIPAEQVEPPPQTGKGTSSRYLKGMGKIAGNYSAAANLGTSRPPHIGLL